MRTAEMALGPWRYEGSQSGRILFTASSTGHDNVLRHAD